MKSLKLNNPACLAIGSKFQWALSLIRRNEQLLKDSLKQYGYFEYEEGMGGCVGKICVCAEYFGMNKAQIAEIRKKVSAVSRLSGIKNQLSCANVSMRCAAKE